ncbi:MAG TPA: hypothetical protein PKM88_10360 [bacterium]|nr:hypothetical protein [bacterium]
MLTLLALVLLRTAWLCDDAYISFRVVDNVLHGYGLRWNIAERVQVYTHPLWLLLLIPVNGLAGEPYYSTLLCSMLLTLGAAYLLLLQAAHRWAVLAIGLLLFYAKGFVDYATSGLENPLAYLLLAAFSVRYLRPPDRRGGQHLLRLSLLAALAMVNRFDAAVLVLPPLLHALWQARSRRALLQLAAGMLPLIAWLLFALAYYGTVIPNTAHAKLLAAGITHRTLAGKGIACLSNTLHWDPLTAAAVIVAVSAALLSPIRRWLGFGLLAGLGYIIWVGGDFMSGRFVAPLFVIAAAILATLLPAAASRRSMALAGAAMVLGLAAHYPNPLHGSDYGHLAQQLANWRDGDIADERCFYYSATGLLAERQPHEWQLQGEALRAGGPAVIVAGNVGLLGYYAGPAVHIIDRAGLCDPLLARLPATDAVSFRIGHLDRQLPGGYLDSIRSGENRLVDAALAARYDTLLLLCRAPLWSAARWRAIVRNTAA